MISTGPVFSERSVAASRLIGGLIFVLAGGTVSAQAPLTNYTRLHSFGVTNQLGYRPAAKLLKASDGLFYGTTEFGGRADGGTVFKIEQNGDGYVVLHEFTGDRSGGDGASPRAGLIEGGDGALYGTTARGGTPPSPMFPPAGTVFKIRKDGSGYTVLYSFHSGEHDGSFPLHPLVESSDGTLYGTTDSGGTGARDGTVFKVNKDGNGYAVLRTFTRASDGYKPGAVLLGSDGALYGTCYSRDSTNLGTVFKLNTDGSGYAVIHNFDGQSPRPHPVLIEGSDGLLCGTTGASDNAPWGGTAFKLNKDGSGFTIIHSFQPYQADFGAPLMEGTDGLLYGTTSDNGGTAFKLNKDGSGYATLHAFGSTGPRPGGYDPRGAPVEGTDGALYGTTYQGGTAGLAAGTVFRVSKDGSDYSVLWNFGVTGGDGARPTAPLVEASDGLLYGTTPSSGLYAGTIFRVTRNGTGYGVLRTFAAFSTKHIPQSSLIEGSDGWLYAIGTAGFNGPSGSSVIKMMKDGSAYTVLLTVLDPEGEIGSPYGTLVEGVDGALYGARGTGQTNFGALFRLNRDGSNYAIVHAFTGTNGDGAFPQTPLLKTSDGALYGTTRGGGTSGMGTGFKVNIDGSGYAVIRSFTGGQGDGASPSSLLESSEGALYGTTGEGGTFGMGTLFKLNKDGSGYLVLHSFGAGGEYNWARSGALVEGPDGALYGTSQRGPSDSGTVFRLNKDGSGYAVLHRFLGVDGTEPRAPLIRGTDGALYGTASLGGDSGFGVVFSLSVAQTLGSPTTSPEGLRLFFSGLPGRTYRVERAPELSGPWSPLTELVVPSEGFGHFQDTDPLPNRAFYRTAMPWQE